MQRLASSIVVALASLLLLGATPASGPARPDYEAHARRLRDTAPQGFTVVVQPPFVVIGDEPPAIVRRRAIDTVKWSVDSLKRDYFTDDPADILDVWLFKDKTSYDKYAWEIFHDRPDTPYGYYSSEHKALVMNIATGGGTLVHEIVHPFMEANFPDCPAWFNEGLGSLYEQSGSNNGHICGYTNWRLAGLQKAIRDGELPSFETLLATGTNDFYTKDRGNNYAQARYLLFYLQQRGLLTGFYKDFLAHHKDDPTGVETLRKTLGEKDLAAFKKRWEAFVLSLTFP